MLLYCAFLIFNLMHISNLLCSFQVKFVDLKTMIVKDTSFKRVIKGLGCGGGWGRSSGVGREL